MADWSDNAKVVLESRYLARDKEGNLKETPDGMLDRVAIHVASAEKVKDFDFWKDKFLEIMNSLEFLPNSPTLINAGRELGQLSACFVLPVRDDIEHIFEMVKQSAMIHKTGGGTGFNFSAIRPNGASVKSTHGVASGPVSFMRAFDVVTDIIKQGGVRRGANMGILNVTHPDIMEFVNCKIDGRSFPNFNISVALNGSFLESAQKDEEIQLSYRGFPNKEKVSAKSIFDAICHNSWLNGEPGLLFLDTINNANVAPWLGTIYATNPCGEAPLLSWESCNLGSINLSLFIKDNDIDYARLEAVTRIAVRFLDNVIEVNKYPRIQIARKSRFTRKIGLGVMGWADMLGKLGIDYDSDEALDLAEIIMAAIQTCSHDESRRLGKEKKNCMKKIKRRNTCLTTIAPTGTLSILADCSSGIEPHFSTDYTKEVLNGSVLKFAVPYDVKTALEISPEWHIMMQAAFQKYTDQAVSKTINLPESATIDDIREAILLGYKLGCKGLTVYRQGTREAPLQLSECNDERCLI